MKKYRYITVLCCFLLCSALILAGVCCSGMSDVAAYTAAETFTVVTTEYQNDTLDTIDDIFSELGIGSGVLVITDLIRYLSQDGNTFASWVYKNYGEDIQIPESVKNMSTGEIITYLTSKLFAGSTVATTSVADMGYTSITTEEQTTIGELSSDGQTVESTTVAVAETTTRYSGNLNVSYKTGDIDFDGKVTPKDARIALRVSAKLETLTAIEFEAADVNDDNKVTAKDARSILRYSAGLTKGF